LTLLASPRGDTLARMNAEWHQGHVMPKNATLEERIVWHREHQKHCACRPIPPTLMEHIRPSPTTKAKTPRSRRA